MGEIRKILIANRGEIALRVMKTCKAMSIKTVAVYSDADKNAPYVDFADEAIHIGASPAKESYLNQDKIIHACKLSGADAIYPGYGFLSENEEFAQRCQDEGIIFIGPKPESIRAMGSKIAAKEIMMKYNVPVIPGYNGDNQDVDFLIAEAEKIGFPVLVKASAGGGGKGMRVVRRTEDLKSAIEGAKREALSSFSDDTLLLERYFDSVRHIEFQIFGDEQGNVLHIFERECSIQRRHQKVIEESPSPFLKSKLRKEMGKAAVKAGEAIQYVNAGTVEFIVDEAGDFFFLEVNTRLQVEHPVTEAVTGLDLVRLQIEIAKGNPIPFKQDDLKIKGHAIECRFYAEDPENSFLPATGTLHHWEINPSESLRVDSGVKSGSEVNIFYDPMLAKIITHGADRTESIQKMIFALENFTALGVRNNRSFLLNIFREKDFQSGKFNTHYLEHKPELVEELKPSEAELFESALACTLYQWNDRQQTKKLPNLVPGWRNNFFQPQFDKYLINESSYRLEYRFLGNQTFEITNLTNEKNVVEILSIEKNKISYSMNQKRYAFTLVQQKDIFFIKHGGKNIDIRLSARLPEPEKVTEKGAYNAPMTGEVVKILVAVGQQIKAGDGLLIINSMKMENTIYAHSDGEIAEIFVAEKTFVESDAPLLKAN